MTAPVRYYTATNKAFDLVLNHFDLRDQDMPEPSKTIDMRSFTHDKGLVWLEFLGEHSLIDAFSWDSEGCIKRRALFGLKPEATREATQDETRQMLSCGLTATKQGILCLGV